MKNFTVLFFSMFFLLGGTTLFAQKKALGVPKYFQRPLDAEGYFLRDTKEKIKAPWIVICDREDAQTYTTINKDGSEANPKEKLKFKDWFYVSDENQTHIRIFKGNVNTASLKVEGTARDFGWIAKESILLWTSGLEDSKTKIASKAFLLNKAEEVKKIMKLEKKEIVKIFKGPETGEVIGDKSIYEFYFVMKKEGGKFLLSKNLKN